MSRRVGTSVAMLERHYSKLTATMAAARLGCVLLWKGVVGDEVSFNAAVNVWLVIGKSKSFSVLREIDESKPSNTLD